MIYLVDLDTHRENDLHRNDIKFSEMLSEYDR